MRQYEISKSSYRCNDCQREMAARQEFVACVQQDPQEDDLLRQDYCLDCWAARAPAGQDVLAFWKTRVPPPTARKKLFIDDDLLLNFFNRLEDADSESMRQFRFVLALVLMRKKLLVYDGLERRGQEEYWVMHLRGGDLKTHVLDPHLDEEKIAQVSRHLGQILEGDL